MKQIFHNFKALLFTSSLMLSLYAQAATITVTNGNDTGAGSLRAAIASAAAGDFIDFSGVTTVTLTSDQLFIDKNLTINGGTGVAVTRNASAANFRIFNINSASAVVIFNKLNITNGKQASQAAGIQNSGTLTLNDCTISNNESGIQGGGIQNDNTLTMNRCFVHSNSAPFSGSGLLIYGSSTTTLNNCVFTNNQGDYAIDIQSAGTLNITNCTIAKNKGGINVGSGSAAVTLKNTIVAENTNTSNANIRNDVNANISASSAYNLIGTEGGNGGLTNGTNNNLVGVSPMFANSTDPDGPDNKFGTADDGLMLTACNLATNAGNNADAPSGMDIASNVRIFGTTVDIGAYEFQANSSPNPTITLGAIPAILAGATSFTIPYTATSSPTTYSISGTGFTTLTDAALPSSPITVNLSPAASINIDFTLTVKNANGCISNAVAGYVVVNIPITQACATATFNGTAPIAPTATTAGVGGRGGIHTYTVPAGVTAIRLEAKGAKGGSSLIIGGGTFNGGQGGRVQATYAVTPGDVLYILVGGKGGNGSPENGTTGRTSSGGGGATVVSKGPIGSGTLLLVAGGGGGAGRLGGGGNSNDAPNSGSGFNGAGGASFSADGGNSNQSDNCGKGGRAINAGGYGGANTCFRPETNGGGYGGGGAGNYNTNNGNAGGGGGGGYVGGNAGATAGGNGGSSYTDASASNVTTTNHSDDNGSVVITIVGSISYTGSPFCQSLTATSAPTTTGYTGGTFSAIPTSLTIDATTGVINPSTSTAGTYIIRYNVSGSNTCPVVATTTVTIIALPIAQASNTGPYSVGRTILLSATGGITYSWSGPNGFTSNISNPLINNTLQSNEGVYTVIVSNGICTATATTNVVVIDPCVQIMQYSYVQAGNPYQPLFDLTNGMNIAQNTNPTSILVRPICPSATIESVDMTISGPVNYTILQNVEPFSLFDNFGNNVYGQVLPAGTYTLTVTGYAQDNLNGGITYGPVVTTFTIVGNMPTVSMPTFTGNELCAGGNTTINFTSTGTFAGGNQFQVLLSDMNGNFNNLTIIGTATSAGNVVCYIPAVTISGANYRMKVLATNPAISGGFNQTSITIHPANLNLLSPTDDFSSGNATKKASQVISATNKINPSASINFQAGKSIMLNAGFEAKAGSVFNANIDGCGNITN